MVVGSHIILAESAVLRSSVSGSLVSLLDKFHIGSCTKVMTATRGAILIHNHFLNWDTTIRQVFPDIEIHPDYHPQLFANSFLIPRVAPSISLPPCGLKSGLFPPDPITQRLFLDQNILSLPPLYSPGQG